MSQKIGFCGAWNRQAVFHFNVEMLFDVQVNYSIYKVGRRTDYAHNG